MSKVSAGFSAVELLITLFVAAAFLTAGYTLYSVITQDSAQIRADARASNIAKEYLDRYRMSAGTCTPSTPVQATPVTSPGLTDVTVSVTISCPNPTIPTVNRITVTVLYNKPQKTFELASYGGAQ